MRAQESSEDGAEKPVLKYLCVYQLGFTLLGPNA